MLVAVVMLTACGNNPQAKKNEGKDECNKECTTKSSAVCISKAIENPAEYANAETAFSAKIAKCDESGNFYACAGEDKSIEIVLTEGITLADAVDKVITLKGKIVDGKLHVSAVKAGECCGEKKEGCCSEGKEANVNSNGKSNAGCCSEKGDKEAKVACDGEKKEACCGEKKAIVES
ncbi:MAG: hypothetical protein LBL90_09000 [Prevotellaceae bacterium]|nr:hypothetical protein [Prevotellaceae bacterium]